MSKNLIRVIPHEEWVIKQKALEQRQHVWDQMHLAWKRGEGPKPNFRHPRDWFDPDTGKPSRWLHGKTYGNYDETRFGPDPIDSVIDRLGIFEGIDWQAEIEFAEANNFGPTNLIQRTGTPEHMEKTSTHYPHSMVNDAEKLGLKLEDLIMFDSAKPGAGCNRIGQFLGLDFDQAQAGAQRDYGYDSFHIQRPGQILMMHHDIYSAVIRDQDQELAWKPEKLKRFVIFMEDWRPGHVWSVGNTNWSHWRAGECITWNHNDMPHATCNLSSKPRYSVHLTGYLTEKTWNFYNKGNHMMRYRPRLDGEQGFEAWQLQEDGSETMVYQA